MMFFGMLNLLIRPEDPYERADKDRTALGAILVELGHMSRDELEKAIAVQKTQIPLGRILVDELKVITEDQLEEALLEQKIRRKTAKLKDISKFHGERNRRLVDDLKEQLHCMVEKRNAVAGK
jgi:hypothetical protein